MGRQRCGTKRWKKYSHSQSVHRVKRKKRAGVQEEICMAPSPGPTEVQVCRRHWSRSFVFSPPLGGGIQVYHPARDGTVSSAAPLLHLSACTGLISPVWWISCSILLSWMIWGIIQKVSCSSYSFILGVLLWVCNFLIKSYPACSLLNLMINCSINFHICRKISKTATNAWLTDLP